MNLFGLTISRQTKAVPSSLSSVSSRGGWTNIIREPFGGAWQRNISWTTEDALAFHAVFSCITLIASDIGKLRIKLVAQDSQGIWQETENPAYSPVLRKPNHFQTRIKFLEQWVISKLIHGNTYIIKERDNRGVVVALYVLDPTLVRPMVGEDGSVWYALSADNLSGVEGGVMAPASEIIHDIGAALYHPLCGVSPISACGLAAISGLRIQNNSANLFGNGSTPSGILTSPGILDPEEVQLMQTNWQQQFSGPNTGKVAVLGSGLAYTALSMKATDAQLIEQLKWNADTVCSVFHVPPFMAGVGTMPTYSNVEALSLQYYTQCLQNPIECIELLLDEGLNTGTKLGTELDLDALMRMDTPTRIKTAAEAIGGGGMSPNEARSRFLDLGRVEGGEAPYLQQQNFSLSALSRRDAQADPFATATPEPPQLPEAEPDEETPEDAEKLFSVFMRKALAA